MTAPCWYDPETELISVSYRYDPEFVKDCQRIFGRKWDAATKTNTFPLESAPEVKVLTTKWNIQVDDSLKIMPEWGTTSSPSEESFHNVTIDGQWIVIRFTYQKEMIDSIHDTIPGASWNDDKRRWQTSIINSNDAVLFAQKWGLTVDPELARKAEDSLAVAQVNHELSGLLEAEPFPIPGLSSELRPYQYAGIEYCVRNHRVIIGDDPGLGKSVTSMSVVAMKDAYPCVIVCKSKLKDIWRNEVKKWFPNATATIVNGTTCYPVPPVDFIIVNYDIAHGWYEYLIERGFKSLIVDESHYIKNGKRSFVCSGCGRGMRGDFIKKCPACSAKDVKAKRNYTVRRTNAAMQLSLALAGSDPVLLLTGTPIENRPVELVRQLECIDRLSVFGGESKFKYRYCGFDGKGAANSLELHRKLRENCYLRRRKTDVFKDLPAEQYVPRYLDVSEKDMARYREVERDVVEYFAQRAAQEAEARGDDAAWAAYQKREQLRRVQDIIQLAGLRGAVAEIKREGVVDWINDFDEDTGGEEKLIVFGEHISLVDSIAEQFAHEAVNFRESKDTRVDEVRFQEDPAIKKWVANLQASKEGFTLTAASNVAFIELPWSPTWLTQGLSRCWGRTNDPHGAVGWCLLVKGTVDEEMWEMLEDKRRVVNAVTDGIAPPEEQTSVQEQLRIAWMERGRALRKV